MEKWIKEKVESLEFLIRERDVICKKNNKEVCQLKYGFDKSVWKSERERTVQLTKFLNTLIKDYHLDKGKTKKWAK